MANIKGIATKVLTMMSAGALFCAAATDAAYGQFQSVFGGAGTETSNGGIIQASDGDFVAVGYSTSLSADGDVYVVKSNRCGDQTWAYSYNISGTDYGVKIRQTADGGYIIAGQTSNENHCCTRRDAFLMKLRSDGAVQWTKTYGGTQDDIALDVMVVSDGYIFAGSTASAGAGNYDGWITRTDLNGAIVWSRVYGGANEDGFRSLDIACSGDIVVAGYTRSHSTTGDYDVYAAKVTAAAGAIVWSHHHGGPNDEQARSIVAYGTDILYIAGYADVTNGGTKGYILKLRCAGGETIADITYDANGTINEDQYTEIKVLPTGNLILSGFTIQPANGFGSYEAWLTEIDPNFAPRWSHIYGGTRPDWGWSVAVVNPQSAQHSLIMAGTTESFGVAASDLYEVFTDINGRSGCNEARVLLSRTFPDFRAQEFPSGNPLVWMECDARTTRLASDRYSRLCSPCPPPSLDGDGEFDLGGTVPEIRSGDAVALRQQITR